MINEWKVARLDDLADGELKEVKAADTKLLLARVGETVYAVGATCPHYGAPLAKGILCEHRLYCPWHHSSFDITNGKLLDPPSLDGLPTYPVSLKEGDVWVRLDKEAQDSGATFAPGALTEESRPVVILGGGAAGYFAAQSLRQLGFTGRLVMLTREAELPYDRPKLSKNFLDGRATADKVPLRPEAFYEQAGVEVQVNQDVTGVDAEAHQITFADGSQLHYSALLVATGGIPNRLDVPGADLPEVITLRTFSNAERALEALPETGQAVVIGASFIGLEVAASLRKRGLSVTVVSPEALPFERILGTEIGRMFQQLHEANGVTFRLGQKVSAIEGTKQVEAVTLENGERLPADLVMVGIGVKPNTAFLSGLSLDESDQGVLADKYLQAAPDLYVAGDIARFPAVYSRGERIRIEHWRVAQQHGYVAASNLVGRPMTLDAAVPFFWTNQYEKRLSYVGHAENWDDIIVHGDVAKQDFLALYCKDNRVLAAASMNRDPASLAIEELMRRQAMPPADAFRNEMPDLLPLVK